VHHLIDPRTGRPVDHALASVTVIAADCMTADALATALFVLGENEGMAVIDRVPDAHAFFVVRTPEGTFRNVYSQGFDRYLEGGADVSE
jgi:thiamine biosynthesis lipoprotein